MPQSVHVRSLRKQDFTLYRGDCRERLKDIEDASVDLVFTSPPYAEQRKNNYNSIPAEEYVSWFLPIGHEIKRVLKPTGSFFLNLAPHAEGGERELYVMELVIALKKTCGFKYIDELVWYKSASPRRWDFRLKNAWEPIYHFGIDRPFINHDDCKIRSESTFVNKRGTATYNDLTGNVGGYHDICDQGSGFTIADNVLYFPTALLVKDKYPHPAKFPLELAEFFVKAYCPSEGTVLDPFAGSGMTALAALRYGRKTIGIELEDRFADMALDRIKSHRFTRKKVAAESVMEEDDLFADQASSS